jgi:hypothetical protein
MITLDEAIAYVAEKERDLDEHRQMLGGQNVITKLYAIQDVTTGKIIFNARGGAYKSADEALAKLDKLEDGKYRIVTYELKEG